MRASEQSTHAQRAAMGPTINCAATASARAPRSSVLGRALRVELAAPCGGTPGTHSQNHLRPDGTCSRDTMCVSEQAGEAADAHCHRLARGGFAAVRAPTTPRVQQRRRQHASLLSKPCHVLHPRHLLRLPGRIFSAEGLVISHVGIEPTAVWRARQPGVRHHGRRELACRRLCEGRLL